MKTSSTLLLLSLLLFSALALPAQADPRVSNVQARQEPGTKRVNITYNLAASTPCTVSILISSDGGSTWNVPRTSVSGHVGANQTGGSKTMVWDAGADWNGQWSDRMQVEVTATREGGGGAGDYMVIDLSGGPSASSYPVSDLSAVPPGGWTDEYKTTKLVMRRIPAGTFTMGSPSGELGREMWDPRSEAQRQVTLTKDFYIGVFEVTQKQWERVMGDWPSWFYNVVYRDSRPVEQVSYYDIRENPANSAISPNWPQSSQVHADSFMGRLRAKTGLSTLDLPTEAQWEYACRAETTTALNTGHNLTSRFSDARMDEVGRYWYNGGSGYSQGGNTSVGTAKVGSYLPNAWGLYDMHGNVYEWCLDWYATSPSGMTDPVGADSANDRVLRGGSFHDIASYCRSATRLLNWPDLRNFLNGDYGGIGFRLARTLP